MDLYFGRSVAFGVLIGLSAISIAIACGPKGGHHGWGQEVQLILPKPTLIPKLAAAFHDGKASVAHKGHHLHLVHHKFKSIHLGKGHGHEYGHGWDGKSFGHHHNGLDHGHGYEFGYAVNNPITKDVKSAYEKGSGHFVKGHYKTNDGHSFKNVHYETNGHEHGFTGPDHFGDFGHKK